LNKPYLTPEDIANELGVSVDTVRNWINRKRLVAIKIGRDWRISRRDYERFLEERKNLRDDDDNGLNI
jgi:excisionase family DNA binding protein